MTIIAGYGGQTEKTHRDGKVFPIDAKQRDILRQSNGVLTFDRGTEDLFQDREGSDHPEKKVSLSYKITKTGG